MNVTLNEAQRSEESGELSPCLFLDQILLRPAGFIRMTLGFGDAFSYCSFFNQIRYTNPSSLD